MPRRFIVEADGGSRSNPGEAAFGAVVFDADSREVVAERGERIGIASNNVAEYRGLIAGLEAVRELDPEAQVDVRMDSKLVVEQMSEDQAPRHACTRSACEGCSPDSERHVHVDSACGERCRRCAGERRSRRTPLNRGPQHARRLGS
jgi:ribonuclease HI